MADGLNYLIATGGRYQPQTDVLGTIGQAAKVNALLRENQAYPEEREWLRQRRGMEIQEKGLDLEAKRQQMSLAPLAKMQAIYSFMENSKNMITPANYDQITGYMRQTFNIPGMMPSLRDLETQAQNEGVRSSDEFLDWFEGWKEKSLLGAKTALDQYRASTERMKATAEAKPKYQRGLGAEGQPVWLQEGKPIPEGARWYEKEGKQPEFMELIDQYNNLPNKNDPKGQFMLARIKKLTETTGFRVEVDKDGNVRILQGPGVTTEGGAAPMGKPSQTKVEEKLINATEMLSRLNGIKTLFKPEYQQFKQKFGMSWMSLKDKVGKLSPDDQASLKEYSKYRRRVYQNMNQYLNDMSGAAITPQEAERLQKALPNPGEKPWEGDSPSVFEANLEDAIMSQKMAIARYNHALKMGLSWKSMSLDNMPEIINSRGAEIEKELGASVVPKADIEKQVRLRLAEEFGLMRK